MASEINCHITTFNAGRSQIHTSYFASSLHTTLQPLTLPPDILVLCLQEIAPIGYSFLGGSLLTPYFSRFAEAVYLAASRKLGKDADYEHVATRNVGMTGIMVFARKAVKDRIKWMEEGGTGVGLWEMGNKGAVGVRLGFEGDAAVTFVSAHLAPMEGGVERRNEDWRRICETLVFEESGQSSSTRNGERQPFLSNNETHGLFTPPSHIFFAGDLNYRTADEAPDPSAFNDWPQPMSKPDDPSHFSKLLQNDQLSRELRAGKTLHHLSEAPINFPPTYKLSSRAQRLAEQAASAHETQHEALQLENIQEQVWLWAKHRIPSWCDRILYLASAAPKEVHGYTALPIQPTSDHRPVAMSFSISLRALDEEQAIQYPRFDIDEGWREQRALARKLELAVGSGAYLGFTGQGQVLLGGTVVGVVFGYLVLNYLIGG